MRLNFCTLFNSNYLSRGLVLYESLLKHSPDFHLYVFAFDDVCFEFLKKQNYSNLTVISLKEFEDEKLLNVKSTRSMAEYCWTCTPSTILYCITKHNLDNCTYIDADMLFVSNPQVLIEEMGNKSVLITEHRYTKEYEQSKLAGKYCVQFVTIKATEAGLKVCNWWREACLDWCYARYEDGKFGDQKYLDDWTTRFEGVHELQHLGGGIAPWNVQQYDFSFENNEIVGKETSTGKIFKAVFFHFHSLKFYKEDLVSLTDSGYTLSNNVIETFFKPYVKLLSKAKNDILKLDNTMNCDGANNIAPYNVMSFKTIFQYYLEGIKSSKKNVLGHNLLKKVKHHYYYKVSNL